MAPEIVWLTEAEIQDRFNKGRYYERFLDDEDESVHLGEVVDVGPSPKDAPKGGRSQTVTFLDRFDDTIVVAHQKCGRPNGTVVEGTWTDPKFLYEGGVRYKALPPGAVVPPDE